MKKSIRNCGLMLMSLLVAGVLTSADAQRGGIGRGGGYRGNTGRTFGNDVARGYRNPYSYRPNVYSYRQPAYSYHQPAYGYRQPAYGYQPTLRYRSRYSPYFGPRYYGIPTGSISITFGGSPYYYNSGIFYRPFGGYYRSVFPPIGLRIGILPMGYLPIYVGPDPYYFYNGTYYRRYDDRNYEVVDAPMGAQISDLPGGAKSVMVNGEKFYELNGTFYKEDRDSKGRKVYTVVGKNGEINNTDEEAGPVGPRMGDRVSQLPENCKTITLNGQKLFVAPDDTYYQAASDGSYTVVGVNGDVNSDNNSNTSSNENSGVM